MIGASDRSQTNVEQDPSTARLRELAARLPDALRRNHRLRGLAHGTPTPLEAGGIAHDHLRLDGATFDGVQALARIPRLSQWGQSPQAHLTYEAAAFARAGPSCVTPRLLGVLSTDAFPPNGALLVEYIDGRKVRFPDDIAAVARCLAHLHQIPIPEVADRHPLRTQTDPASETLAIVEEQAGFIGEIPIAPDSRLQITEEIDALRRLSDEAHSWPPLLAFSGTDTHPGNYLIRDDGRAVFVDLEKAMFGMPAIDLAHATLYTSTMWDADCAVALDPSETERFYACYAANSEPDITDALSVWRLPMRRLTWLRTLTWCVRWQALSARDPDWAPSKMPARVRAHVRATIDDFLSPETIHRIRSEWK